MTTCSCNLLEAQIKNQKSSTNFDQKLWGLVFLIKSFFFFFSFPEPLNDPKHPTNFLINLQRPEKPALCNTNTNYRRARTCRCLYSPDKLKLCFQIQATVLATTWFWWNRCLNKNASPLPQEENRSLISGSFRKQHLNNLCNCFAFDI